MRLSSVNWLSNVRKIQENRLNVLDEKSNTEDGNMFSRRTSTYKYIHTRIIQSGPYNRAVTGNHLEEISEEPTREIRGFGVCIEWASEVGVLR